MSTDREQQPAIEPPQPPAGLQQLLNDLVGAPPEDYAQRLQLAQVLTTAWHVQALNAQVTTLQQNTQVQWANVDAQNNAASALREQIAALNSRLNIGLEIGRNFTNSTWAAKDGVKKNVALAMTVADAMIAASRPAQSNPAG